MKRIYLFSLVVMVVLLANQAKAWNNGPLQQAVVNHDLGQVKILIAQGENINSRDWTIGRTPLMLAATNGDYEIAKLLLESGADINLKSRGGNTALHYACYEGHFNVAGLLIKHGANMYAINKSHTMPIGIASYLYKVDLAKLD